MLGFRAILGSSFLAHVASETQVATFDDDSCQISKEYFTAVDGYPDGVCMDISTASRSSYGSFMISSLDSGCAGAQ